MLHIPSTKTQNNVEPLFSETDIAEKRRCEAWLGDRLKKSRVLPAGELLSEVVTVTPSMAEIILSECNRGNRGIRRQRVSQYATMIREGRWKLTSQGISISRDGLLNNGQHRLHAVIEAASPVRFNVTFGEERAVFDILDTGAVRGGSDTLHVAGYKNTACLAAAARVLMLIERGVPSSNLTFANDAVKTWVDGHQWLEHHTTPASSLGKRLRTSSAGLAAAFFLIAKDSDHHRRLTVFQSHLADGAGLPKRDPILALRDGLITGDLRSTGNPGTPAVLVAGSIVNTWNLWVRGRKGNAASIRYTADQPFPVAE